MAVVKGTKPRHWRVVEYHPRLRIWVGGCLLFAFLAAAQGAYWFGFKNGMAGQERALNDLGAVKQELDSARELQARLKQEIESARLGSEVDQKSLEEVRREVLQLKSDLASLDEENQFYRNLMSPSGNARGLNFGAVELVETDKERHFRYKIVMQQLATDHVLLNGTLSVNIIGRRAGEVIVLPLHELSSDVTSANIKLRFKYFQNIEGELIVPLDFEPQRIEMVARSTGKKATTVEKRFGWLVEEKE